MSLTLKNQKQIDFFNNSIIEIEKLGGLGGITDINRSGNRGYFKLNKMNIKNETQQLMWFSFDKITNIEKVDKIKNINNKYSKCPDCNKFRLGFCSDVYYCSSCKKEYSIEEINNYKNAHIIKPKITKKEKLELQKKSKLPKKLNDKMELEKNEYKKRY